MEYGDLYDEIAARPSSAAEQFMVDKIGSIRVHILKDVGAWGYLALLRAAEAELAEIRKENQARLLRIEEEEA